VAAFALNVSPALRAQAEAAVKKMPRSRMGWEEEVAAWLNGHTTSESGGSYGDAPRGPLSRYWRGGFYAHAWKKAASPFIRMAAEMPKGAPERRIILAGLMRMAKDL